jgi:phosphate acetyltransferase
MLHAGLPDMAGDLISELLRRAALKPASVVFPEPQDERIVQAAEAAARAGLARPILAAPPRDLASVRTSADVQLRPITAAEVPRVAAAYARRRGVPEAVARRLVRRAPIFAAMMVAMGEADAMVAGACHATAVILQAAGLAIGYVPGVSRPSGAFLMVVRSLGGRPDVPLLLADCAVQAAPGPEDLAGVALATARTARRLLDEEPRVAMLSFSTHGSARHERVDAVRRATDLVREQLRDGLVDGELQLDAAVDPEVARRKGVGDSAVAGRANVLVCPDLDAGNIAYKALQYLGGARAIGPILQGFAKPVSDLSRGAGVDDILALTAITVLQV